MFPEFLAATQSVKVLGEILRNASDLKNYNEVAAALAKVNEALLAAQASAMQSLEKNNELLQEVRKLRDELEKVEAWRARASTYTLVKTANGGVVRAFSGEPQHYACPSCFEKHEIQILQDMGAYSGDFQCPGCKTNYPINVPKPIHVPTNYNPYA